MGRINFDNKIKEYLQVKYPLLQARFIRHIHMVYQNQNQLSLHRILGVNFIFLIEMLEEQDHINQDIFEIDKINQSVLLQTRLYREIVVLEEEIRISNNKEINYDVKKEVDASALKSGKNGSDFDSIIKVPPKVPFDYFQKSILEENPYSEYTTDMTNIEEYLDLTSSHLQVIKADIISFHKAINYPITVAYKCTDMKCKHHNQDNFYITYAPYSEVKWESTIKCNNVLGINNDGNPSYCNKSASIDYDKCSYKIFYYYSMRVKIKKQNVNEPGYEEVKVFSTKQLKRFGYQTVAGFKVPNKNPTEIVFMLIDTEEFELCKFDIKEESDSKTYSIIKNIDDFIYKQIGHKVVGVETFKMMLLIQSTYQNLKIGNFLNLAALGDPGVGKSYVIKKYLPVLYPNYLFTTGLRVSEPAMRGTTIAVPSITGKDERIETIGHLGTYKSILIEEGLGQVQSNGSIKGITDDLKDEFEIETTEYANNKAFSSNLSKKKTANILLTGNIDSKHKEKYIALIRKRYMVPSPGALVAPHPLDPNINLFLHIDEYKFDPKLQLTIAEVRKQYEDSNINWATGIETPTMQRYPLTVVFDNEGVVVTQEQRINMARNILQSSNIDLTDEHSKLLENGTMAEFYEASKKWVKESNLTEEDVNYNLIKYDETALEIGINMNAYRSAKVPNIILDTLRIIEREKRISNKTIEIGKKVLKVLIAPHSTIDLSISNTDKKHATYTNILNEIREFQDKTEKEDFDSYIENVLKQKYVPSLVDQHLIKIKANKRAHAWLTMWEGELKC